MHTGERKDAETMAADCIRLIPGIQHYPWGQKAADGQRPFIADLLGIDAPPETPFAELWIGAHPAKPAEAHLPDGRRMPLNCLLAEQPEDMLGTTLIERGWTELPFLLKVLSAAEPLSIQAHPDKALAERLHARDPEHYPDPNHKPEIAIGLLGLEALSQFRPVPDIIRDLDRLPPLRRFVEPPDLPDDSPAARKAWLRTTFGRIMHAAPQKCARTIRDLRAHLASAAPGDLAPADQYFLLLADLHPEDRGAFAPYFLNVIHLERGEAVFLEPDEPHAYLRGVIIECMANSDNVVRAGLTSKFTDTDVLLEMLTWRDRPPVVTRGEEIAPGVRLYAPPAPEFRVEWRDGSTAPCQNLPADNLPAVLLLLSGRARLLDRRGRSIGETHRGDCWFLPAQRGPIEIRFEQPGECVLAAPNARMP